jgi:hypothetical protein
MANVNFHGYTSGGSGGAVDSVNGKTGAVVLYGTDIAMSSSNSETITSEIEDINETLSGLATVATSGSYADLTNKPTIPDDLNDLDDVVLTSPQNAQILKYDSSTSKWVNANESGGGGGATIDDTTISTLSCWSSSKTNSEITNRHKVTNKEVTTQSWTQDTTSQSGSTLYKKQVSLNHVYANPSVDIGSASGSVLPTTAQQEAYDLIQYVTVDTTVPCLYLYASDIPTDGFYINCEGVD